MQERISQRKERAAAESCKFCCTLPARPNMGNALKARELHSLFLPLGDFFWVRMGAVGHLSDFHLSSAQMAPHPPL